MRLLKISGLLLLALGLMPFSTVQASHSSDWKEWFCKKYPSHRYCKPKPPACEYDLTAGAVYFNGNTTPSDGKGNPVQNDLIVFLRNSDGTLSNDIKTHTVKSGGFGNQAGIVTSGQNAVIHTGSGDKQYVFMINAGFDVTQKSYYYDKYGKKHSRKINRNGSVSVFKVNKCDVKLVDVKSTLGQEPRAVTRDTLWTKKGDLDLVYVVNAGSGEVAFNGCPGLPEGFIAPTSGVNPDAPNPLKCGPRAEIKDFDPTSIVGYKFDKKRGKLYTLRRDNTYDENGDPAQISFMNEGRQLIVAQRNTFFALGDGTEDDIVEVFNLDEYGLPGAPVVSTTTGNDNFGFSVLKRPGKDYDDCVYMTHGSFQQRDQGGVSVFRTDGEGVKQRVIPNKPDGGSDTCWTAISRTNTLYTAAFFDSEISIRQIQIGNPDTDECNVFDGGPPVVLNDKGHPMFTGDPLGYKHRVTASSIFKGGPLGTCPSEGTDGCRNGDQSLVTDQTDFLFEAGGLDMAVSQNPKTAQYLYNVFAPVPFYFNQDGEKAKGAPAGGNFLYPPTTQIAIFRVIENCENPANQPSIYDDGCRVGDLEYVGHQSGLPGSGFGMASY